MSDCFAIPLNRHYREEAIIEERLYYMQELFDPDRYTPTLCEEKIRKGSLWLSSAILSFMVTAGTFLLVEDIWQFEESVHRSYKLSTIVYYAHLAASLFCDDDDTMRNEYKDQERVYWRRMNELHESLSLVREAYLIMHVAGIFWLTPHIYSFLVVYTDPMEDLYQRMLNDVMKLYPDCRCDIAEVFHERMDELYDDYCALGHTLDYSEDEAYEIVCDIVTESIDQLLEHRRKSQPVRCADWDFLTCAC